MTEPGMAAVFVTLMDDQQKKEIAHHATVPEPLIVDPDEQALMRLISDTFGAVTPFLNPAQASALMTRYEEIVKLLNGWVSPSAWDRFMDRNVQKLTELREEIETLKEQARRRMNIDGSAVQD